MSIYDRLSNDPRMMLNRMGNGDRPVRRTPPAQTFTPPARREPPVLQTQIDLGGGLGGVALPQLSQEQINQILTGLNPTIFGFTPPAIEPEVERVDPDLGDIGVSEEVIDDVADEPEPQTEVPVMPPAPPPSPPTAPPAPPPEPPSSLTGLGGFYSPEQVQLIMNPPRTQVNTSDMEKLLQLQGNTFRNFLVQPAPVDPVPAPVDPTGGTLGPGGIVVGPILDGNPYVDYNNLYNPQFSSINNPFFDPMNFTGITSLVPNDAIGNMLSNQMVGNPRIFDMQNRVPPELF